MKSKNIDRLRLKTGNRDMSLGERVELLERAVIELARAVRADFNELDLDSLSLLGQKQLEEKIKEESNG